MRSMINTKICFWLLENADAPIRYRVARELLKDNSLAKKIEKELLDNPIVKQWLKKLATEPPKNVRNIGEMAHGSSDFHLENAMVKITQLGLHAGLGAVKEGVRYYTDTMKASPLYKPYRKAFISHTDISDLILPANLLTLGGFKDKLTHAIMMESLDKMYNFAKAGNCNIYMQEYEIAELKGIPPNWQGNEHFIRQELFDENGLSWPLIYDILGLYGIYGTHNKETDTKIDKIIDFISTDDFHNTIADGYGILVLKGKSKYKSHGWDPKYPGWFDVAGYIEKAVNKNAKSSLSGFSILAVPKLLFFAMYISRFPLARKTNWFTELVNCLERYKTEKGTYEFPYEWFVEKQGYAVLGNHMSFGESRKKKNWCEIESTFYMQLLKI